MVHRVDVRHRGDREEEDGRAVRDGLVALADGVELLGGLVGDHLLGRDLVRDDLGIPEDLDGGRVVEDVAL